jgi:hypothetical protein
VAIYETIHHAILVIRWSLDLLESLEITIIACAQRRSCYLTTYQKQWVLRLDNVNMENSFLVSQSQGFQKQRRVHQISSLVAKRACYLHAFKLLQRDQRHESVRGKGYALAAIFSIPPIFLLVK